MRRLIIFILTLSILLICAAYYMVFIPNTQVSDDGYIYIRKGDSFESIMDTLEKRGYLNNAYTFRQVAKLKHYPSLIKEGRYRIKDKMNNNELVNMLRSGSQAAENFTFNNLRTLEQLAELLSDQLNVDSVEFMTLAKNPKFVSGYGFTIDNFVAMFIPNTYQLYWNTSAKDFIERMHKEYGKFWSSARISLATKADLTPIGVITLASIIEEETINPEEYPVIAGVYINRLRKNIALSACPTLKFALGDFSLQRILDKHMTIDSPYNTYKYRGLPPGPVRMPSIKVILAVLNHQRHDYLYFCAKSDFSGSHHFSKTLQQHNKYAAEYHKALDKRKIYK